MLELLPDKEEIPYLLLCSRPRQVGCCSPKERSNKASLFYISLSVGFGQRDNMVKLSVKGVGKHTFHFGVNLLGFSSFLQILC